MPFTGSKNISSVCFNELTGRQSQTARSHRLSSGRMMSAAQLTANQANARRSGGPITVEGKTRSSQNALRHGLTAKTALLPTEDPEAYKKHCEAYFRRFAHRDEIERQLIQQLADIQWRLARVPAIEAALLTPWT